MKRLGFGLGVLSAAWLLAPSALAFCRTTTCDPNNPKEHCQLDANMCVTTGKPLGWRSSCVTIGVQQLGSPTNGFSYDEVAGVVERAFGTWMQANCGSAGPSINVEMIGPIECGISEYNSKVGNANVVVFRNPWPYVGAANAIGLTTTRFDTESGDLWDADIEINGADEALSIGDPIAGDDLLSVLTHEAGHFLGLSHSPDQSATMKAVYNPRSDGAAFRSLADDDIAGICTIYPPGRKASTSSCENRHGFSSQCGADQPAPNESQGCSLNTREGVSGRGGATNTAVLLLLTAACCARLARRKRIV
jgi:hypothetical protein